MSKRRYWISTKGKKTILFSGLTQQPSDIIAILYGMEECSAFRYYLIKVLKWLTR